MKRILKIFMILSVLSIAFVSCNEKHVSSVDDLRLVRLSPSSGYSGGIIKILGRNFSEEFGENSVTIGGKEAKVLEYDAWELTVVVPENEESEKYEVTVTTPKGSIGGLFFEYIPKPEHEYIVSTYAGSSKGNEDGIKSTAKFTFPEGLIFTPDKKDMIVLQRGNPGFAVRKIDAYGNVKTLSTSELLKFPWQGGFDKDGNLYFANKGAAQILKMNNQNEVSVVNIDGITLKSPMSVQFDPDNIMWLINRDGNEVAKINGTKVEKTFDITSPTCLTIDNQGNVFVGSGKTGYIHMIDKAGEIHNIAGIGKLKDGENRDGASNAAVIGSVNGIFIGTDNILYFTDVTSQSVRKLVPDADRDYTKGKVETIADGFYPSDILVNDACDKIYVSSATSHVIKLIEVI